jgi:hypothetical protein
MFTKTIGTALAASLLSITLAACAHGFADTKLAGPADLIGADARLTADPSLMPQDQAALFHKAVTRMTPTTGTDARFRGWYGRSPNDIADKERSAESADAESAARQAKAAIELRERLAHAFIWGKPVARTTADGATYLTIPATNVSGAAIKAFTARYRLANSAAYVFGAAEAANIWYAHAIAPDQTVEVVTSTERSYYYTDDLAHPEAAGLRPEVTLLDVTPSGAFEPVVISALPASP